MGCISLNRLIGARGFEPPTPWSRTRLQRLLKSVETRGFLMLWIESFAARSRLRVETR